MEKGHNGVPGSEMAMRGERFNLEDQVGGLIDGGSRRVRRRRTAEPIAAPADPQRYEIHAPARPAIRAARASDRRVA